LQALSLIKEGAMIYLVDNSSESIDISKERFEQVVIKEERENFKIKVRRINEIESDIDIAIIATHSLSRAKVTKELILNNRVKYIIFEKFLFQNRKDYSEIQSLLEQNRVKSWVNQWVSSSLAFNDMANWIGSSLKEINVDGKNWGLACNSVHFLDFLDSISGRDHLEIKNIDIDKKIFASKRSGYFELSGKISIQSANGIMLNLSSKGMNSDNVIKIKMIGENKRLEATLSQGEMNCVFYTGQAEVCIKKYTIPMQSQTTASIVKNISQNGTCTLPTYEQSIKHHLVLFDCFKDVFRENLGLSNNCPIT
jgi:hypothetical protein